MFGFIVNIITHFYVGNVCIFCLAMFGNAAKDSHPSGAEIKKAWGYISMA
jgi:hypothetical protein